MSPFGTAGLAIVVVVATIAWYDAMRLPAQNSVAPLRPYDLVRRYPHDTQAFTQGLIYRDGWFYESTGLKGESSLRRVRPETGEVVQRRMLAHRYFGEGLTDWRGELIQLTWDTNVAFVYDAKTFEPRRSYRYAGEGWGLTQDGQRLIMSDGSSWLRFLKPDTFAEEGRIQVRDGGHPIDRLNELEVVDGEVFANVWLTDRIAIIDARSGVVSAWLDLTALSRFRSRGNDAVLNGIAYDAAERRLFVTGKLWPEVFEIRIHPGR